MEPTAAELARVILRLSPYLRRLPWRLELELIGIQAEVVRTGVGGRRRSDRLRISELTINPWKGH